jgi:hypothetical protein
VTTTTSLILDLVAQKPKRADLSASSTSLSGPKTTIVPVKKPAPSSGRNSSTQVSAPASKPSTKSSSVFDRLTDVKSYTGSHKERFHADGTGKGLAGRDSPAKGRGVATYRGGDVKDLSQILRS